ncbi:hypothetical protein [Halapricum hydrolyticum]|uniref:Uncharacterized protein n=1 Tax=Halapricum hydrolyticum TaxID=2979991 RepID=A0AAE3LG53_9EURY|nr:hypothetical protein [Halapricum hydrolyticum]MCU4719350.1 hypothetical protein [Halapricum hydrolyticum]MCU4728385.1 hypothetical protein [Halapricum hydrolyticum]
MATSGAKTITDVTVPEPALPVERLREKGWVRIESDQRVLARLPVVTVHGHTVAYGDDRLRDRVIDAIGCDRSWRFFFATRLALSPSPPGSIPSMVVRIVRSRVRDGFADRLRERGFTDVSQSRREELRVRSGERASLTGYRARDLLTCADEPTDLPVEGWVGVWNHDGTFYVAGGAFPAVDLGDVLDVDLETDPGTFRTELFELIRTVGE